LTIWKSGRFSRRPLFHWVIFLFCLLINFFLFTLIHLSFNYSFLSFFLYSFLPLCVLIFLFSIYLVRHCVVTFWPTCTPTFANLPRPQQIARIARCVVELHEETSVRLGKEHYNDNTQLPGPVFHSDAFTWTLNSHTNLTSGISLVFRDFCYFDGSFLFLKLKCLKTAWRESDE
jgi:hypothetical protein